MRDVANATGENSEQQVISAACCIDSDAFERFGRVLRHFAVGLVDQAISLRILSSDPRIESLTLGPVQTLVHQPIVWPVRKRRVEQLIDALSHQPPTIVHALSHRSYGVAKAIAQAFDIDLVFQVTSMADCDAIAQTNVDHVGRFLAISEPLATFLTTQLSLPKNLVELIRPGVQVSKEIACFTEPDRTPTLLCTSNFEKDSGVDRLIVALELLRQREQTPLVFLLGRGRYESALRNLVRQRNLLASVTFAQPQGDPLRAIRSADIFVRPTIDTDFNADSLQALGAGVAVVAVAGGVGDHLRDGETARICRPESAEALADAIEGLLTNRAEARRLAATGLEYVRANHAMSAMAERTAAVYRNLALPRTTFSLNTWACV